MMSRRNQTPFVVLTLCVGFACADRALPAQIVSGGEIAGIGVGIAAAGAAIGVGVYYAVKHNRSVTGCARSGTSGITMTSESDNQTYTLTGDVAGIKPGDRVRVSGKKVKEKPAGTNQFVVEKVSKDFGACKVPVENPTGSS